MGAGIYIHIPFCKQKCFYCDFFSVANLGNKNSFIHALIKEIELQKNYLDSEEVVTIYFGGGTPSLFTAEEISILLHAVYSNFKIAALPEVTLEANPDDIHPGYLYALRQAGINRLSIGVQSFDDDDLKLLNRRHNAQQAIHSVKISQEAGFDNISIDLIYGLPGMTAKNWRKNLKVACTSDVRHISAYHLSVEAKTVFAHFLEKGKIKLPAEEQSFEQFKILISETKNNGFTHYEISNFAKKGFLSKHNSNYWKQKKYLGLGPSAHSFNLVSRQWNISNVGKYVESINSGFVPCEKEILNETAKFNDYIMTSLRTMWGTNTDYLRENFGEKRLNNFLKTAEKYQNSGHLKIIDTNIVLTDEGKYISDKIIEDFFII
ncbi:MAG: radical SAM family heme chaperone HemW [Bacteroidia bacterium]|nr:radical SAM family heme chaperone HemW [Bacteroidia bacterium]